MDLADVLTELWVYVADLFPNIAQRYIRVGGSELADL